MAKFMEGLAVTLKTALRKPVTEQYPDPDKRHQVAERYMGFPALLWDYGVPEPYCTGCMVCVRACPTQCMSAQMTDNPKHADDLSRRRKIIETFEINLGRCILCGICVDVCNFDAIEMSHEHELSKYERNGNRADLGRLLEMGREYQGKTGWSPTNPAKNSGVPVAKPVVSDSVAKPAESEPAAKPAESEPAAKPAAKPAEFVGKPARRGAAKPAVSNPSGDANGGAAKPAVPNPSGDASGGAAKPAASQPSGESGADGDGSGTKN